MREITRDRFKNCKNYKEFLPKMGSNKNDLKIPPVIVQMLIKMIVNF